MDRQLQTLAQKLAPVILPILARLFSIASTYTVTYLGGTTPGTTTYTTQLGFYFRIFDIVFFHLRLTWTNATGTGNAQVSIPFTAVNTAGMAYTVGVWSSGLTFANGNVVGRILGNEAFFTFQSLLTNAGPSASAVETAGDVIASGYFRV